MHQRKMIRLACVLVALVATLVGRTAGAGATHPFQCGAWNNVTSPNPYQAINILNAVTTVSATYAWAVGWGADSINGPILTLTQHWNGTSWSVIPSPNPASNANFLEGVTAISATDVWAVGDSDQYLRTLIEHWDGKRWTVIPSPNLGTLRNILYSVTAISTNDVWAVGLYRNGSNTPNQALIEHWNGKHWKLIPSPNLSSYDNYLSGVTAISTNDVWAVGLYSHLKRSSVPKTLIEHWDGTKWGIMPSPNLGKGGNNLNGVAAVSSQDVWAVGEGGGSSTLTEHWNGTKWHSIKSPDGSNNTNILYGVAAIAANDIWAVGIDSTFNPYSLVTLTEHWDGKHWKVISSPNVAAYNNLSGVTATSTHTIWAVGYSQNQYGPLYPSNTLIEYYC